MAALGHPEYGSGDCAACRRIAPVRPIALIRSGRRCKMRPGVPRRGRADRQLPPSLAPDSLPGGGCPPHRGSEKSRGGSPSRRVGRAALGAAGGSGRLPQGRPKKKKKNSAPRPERPVIRFLLTRTGKTLYITARDHYGKNSTTQPIPRRTRGPPTTTHTRTSRRRRGPTRRIHGCHLRNRPR